MFGCCRLDAIRSGLHNIMVFLHLQTRGLHALHNPQNLLGLTKELGTVLENWVVLSIP